MLWKKLGGHQYIWSRLADIDRDWQISHDFHISLILLEVFEDVFLYTLENRDSVDGLFSTCLVGGTRDIWACHNTNQILRATYPPGN